MKTLLLAVVLAGVAYAAVLFGALGFLLAAFGAFIGLGAALLSVIAAVAASVFGVMAAVLAVALVIVIVLSPLWLPALAVIGIVALCRRANHT